MSILIVLILACPPCVALGVLWGRRLERAESMSPKQAEAMLARARKILTPISPEEAVRNGETG